MKKISKWLTNNLPWLILLGVGILCTIFLLTGKPSDNGFITLDGKDAVITDTTKQWIEDANDALARVMGTAPTDEETIKANDEPMGQGFYVDIDTIISRILPDGHNDNGNGWQCSRYTGYLATGKWSYSSAHPDYGPVNGKNVAQYLVDNYGFKYVDQPVKGAIGSGGFNTPYGHTAVYLYSTGANTAMVSDANYVPLTVNTHNLNISGWVWVVPGNYNPEPTPEPTPTPSAGGEITYTYSAGDYFSKVLTDLGLDEGNLWGESGTVKYYTKQLIEQGMLDANGNVKLGKSFTLTAR